MLARSRPPWVKSFVGGAAELEPLYPRFGDFTELWDRLDPDRKFGNDFLARVLGCGVRVTGRSGAKRMGFTFS